MDIQFYGANCVSISNKQVRIVIDDNVEDLGGKPVLKDGDIAFFTGPHSDPKAKVKLALDHAGEYEVSEVSVYGIPLKGHMDDAGKKDATAYKFIMDDIRVLVTGHIHPDLNEKELEAIGIVDIMIVPVGGNGYTLDPVGAQKVIKAVEPKLVIPTHYDDSSLSFPVPQQPLEQALSTMSIEPKDRTDKLRVKSSDLTEDMQLIVLNRT